MKQLIKYGVIAGSLSATPALLATNTPIAVSGFNRDVVVESSCPANTEPGNYASGFDVPHNIAFYEIGLVSSDPADWPTTGGLPTAGILTSLIGGTTFQLAPYAANNTLLLDEATPAASLTLNTAFAYTSLSILATAANGGGDGTFVIHFTDLTSSSPITYHAPDWFDNTADVAAQGIGRVFLGYGAVRGDGVPDNPRLYQTDIDLSALGLDGKDIASLTFNQASGADTTGIFAVSGTPAAVPEPTTLAFLGLSLAGVLGRRRCPGGFTRAQLSHSPIIP